MLQIIQAGTFSIHSIRHWQLACPRVHLIVKMHLIPLAFKFLIFFSTLTVLGQPTPDDDGILRRGIKREEWDAIAVLGRPTPDDDGILRRGITREEWDAIAVRYATLT
jgi:hypothetical protein